MTSLAQAPADLLDQTIAMVGAAGLEQVSLRAIASAAGCTTTVIFQRYGGKAGLLAASFERALARDTAMHKAMLRRIEDLPWTHFSLSDFIAHYITSRAGQEVARFWSEVLFKARQIPESLPDLARWHEMRTDFWRRVLPSSGSGGIEPAMVAGYSAMEEVYAYALADDVHYQLLLRETIRALTWPMFDPRPPRTPLPSISQFLNKAPLPSTSGPDKAAVREKLLAGAVKTIIDQGIGSVNKRSAAAEAGVSSSMIAYHFGDMTGFVNEAVWRALVNGIPNELDPTQPASAMPCSMDEWFETLDVHIRPRSGATPGGFYTGFALITGQACLLAKTRPSLMSLVEHLRGLEGWGTYRVSQAIAPAETAIARDQAAAFGVWIKAEAVLREAALSKSAGDIGAIAHRILPLC